MTKPSGGNGWPALRRAPKGAPNVLVFLTDDVGYGACSTFGGPIPTPELDRLAKEGLRYTQFNTTAMCSPTRASLLTGRNPHNVNMGGVANRSTGFDGYTSVIPRSAGTLAEILCRNGYTTGMFGKSHLTPDWEMSHAGPFDRWPTGLGFDYFYGFLGFDTDQWAPNLVEGTTFIEPPHDRPDYHFDKDIADRAIHWIRQQRSVSPDQPFFLYYATGTAHAPHHAPKDWIERFRGRFDEGWDAVRRQTFERQKQQGVIPEDAELTPRPANLPAWDSIADDERKTGARLMEAYAGALAHADHQMGRVIQALRDMGAFDDTLILFIQGDNGGSAEGGLRGLLFEQSLFNSKQDDHAYLLERIDEVGGPTLFNHYPAAWAWAMNTPFQYYKQVASHFGGMRNGLVVSWPSRIKEKGGARTQFHHVSDIMPTVLEAVGIEAPAEIDGIRQDPLDGMSMCYSFDAGPKAPSARTEQIFESLENFGIYKDGWLANSRPTADPWQALQDRVKIDPEKRIWELYKVSEDYSQARDLAGSQPEKLAELQELFWRRAAENNILPIHPPSEGVAGKPSLGRGRTEFTFYRGLTRIAMDAGPHTVGRSFTIAAEVVLPQAPAQGVIISAGSRFFGYALFMKDGHLVFHYNAIEPDCYTIRSPAPLEAGAHEVRMRFVTDAATPGSGGTSTLSIDGAEVARGRIGMTIRNFQNTDGFNIGAETISPVSPEYTVQNSTFNGELGRVIFNIEAV